MRLRQSGQVLAEAVLVLLVLAGFIWAIHQVGLWQFQWQKGWLAVQKSSNAAVLGHSPMDALVTQRPGGLDLSRGPAERSFALGDSRWLHAQRREHFVHHAWRLVGTGRASTDAAVVKRMASAPVVWREVNTRSQAVLSGLSPALVAVDAAWNRSTRFGRWLEAWQASTPTTYLRRGSQSTRILHR